MVRQRSRNMVTALVIDRRRDRSVIILKEINQMEKMDGDIDNTLEILAGIWESYHLMISVFAGTQTCGYFL